MPLLTGTFEENLVWKSEEICDEITQNTCAIVVDVIVDVRWLLEANIYRHPVLAWISEGYNCWTLCQLYCKKPIHNSYTQVGFNSRHWLHCHSNSWVSRTKIENLKWQIGGDIIPLTFEKFVTSLSQKLKILRENKNWQSMYWLQSVFSLIS